MTDPISYQFTAVKQRRENRGDIEFELALRQQPKQSRMCGIGEKADRRPIDPPPIVQLRVVDPSLSPSESKTYLQNPYYFMYASLMASDIDEEVHLLRDGKTRSTTGSVVSSLYHLKDTDNTDAGFFVFPDLSVRIEGRYRLKLSLFEIIGKEVYHCKSILSDQFVVYSAKKFPGMEESTLLSRAFADQGLKIRIRKELRQRRRASKRQDSQPESSDKRRKQDDSLVPAIAASPMIVASRGDT
ncbi:velvet factor-domain-containing protein [Gongronella butleri]|nr:velvet factor-domain-containing protein [Gongronella butleri]